VTYSKNLTYVIILYLLFFSNVLIWGFKYPIVPSSIDIPLSDANRGVKVHIPSERTLLSRELEGLTFADLPAIAICTPHYRGAVAKSKFVFDCAWNEPAESISDTRASVSILVPLDNGISDWKYDSKSLQLRPEMHHWFWYNITSLFTVCILMAFGIVLHSIWSEVEADKTSSAN